MGSEKSIICIFAGKESEEKNKELGIPLTIIYKNFNNKNKKFRELLNNFFFTNPNLRVLTNETSARAWAEALR